MAARVRTRALTARDQPLLVRATLDNLNWSEERFTARDVAGRAELVHYTRPVPARGDFGRVAEDGPGEAGAGAVGVGWALFLPATDPGYGFLDQATPEVSLWVRADRRGHGIGRMLLREVQAGARARGVPRLSLSVEAGNPAERLYAAEGFTPVAGREQDGVMVWTP